MRQTIYNKYNGCCAYCGKKITLKQMQVDHIVPLFRNDDDETLKKWGRIRGANNLDNLNPACARCNRYKSTMTLQQFRNEIEKQILRLEERSWNYRIARDFGLVEETFKPVRFYFEELTIKEPIKSK